MVTGEHRTPRLRLEAISTWQALTAGHAPRPAQKDPTVSDSAFVAVTASVLSSASGTIW
jgi:hypothetical protein